MALNRSPEFCLKLTWYLLKAGHVHSDGANFHKLGRGPPGDATYQISRLYAVLFQKRRFVHVFHYISLCKT